MKNIFVHLLAFMLLMTCCVTAAAQKTDSIYKIKKIRDSIYWLSHTKNYVPDSFYSNQKIRLAESYRKKSRQDSLVYSQKRLADSAYRIRVSKAQRAYSINTLKIDSFNRYKVVFTKRTDSLHSLAKLQIGKSDSLRKIQSLNINLDTFHRYSTYKKIQSDSLRKLIYLQQIKTDSLRIKKYLIEKKTNLQLFYKDSLMVRQGFASKPISMEITCNIGDTVYIENNYKKLTIKTIPSQKIRLSTNFNYKDAVTERDDKIFQSLGIELSRTNTSVTAKINNNIKPNTSSAGELSIDEKLKEANSRKKLLIEVPENIVIVLTSKYGENKIESFVTNLKADVNYGSLRFDNAELAIIKSRYSTIKANAIKNAELDLFSTNFTASNIVSMSVVSNSSTVNLNDCNTTNMASTSDNYKFENAISIAGSKNFGNLQVENLKDKLVLTGASADIKIDKLAFEATFIKIDNKYADLKLPLYDQKNYTLNYEGSYKDVNKLSTATQQLSGMGSITAKYSMVNDGKTEPETKASIHKTKFEAVAGNINDKHTKIDIVCPFCNVVFN